MERALSELRECMWEVPCLPNWLGFRTPSHISYWEFRIHFFSRAQQVRAQHSPKEWLQTVSEAALWAVPAHQHWLFAGVEWLTPAVGQEWSEPTASPEGGCAAGPPGTAQGLAQDACSLNTNGACSPEDITLLHWYQHKFILALLVESDF